MGNICRSPTAEAIMNNLIENKNLSDYIEVDSAGTINYHEGESADRRMIKHASARGYSLDSRARQFNSHCDFNDFDYIIAMDDENFMDIKSMDLQNKFSHKIFRMVDFSDKYNVGAIPDPYYKGVSGFEEVLDLLEDAVMGLLRKVEEDVG